MMSSRLPAQFESTHNQNWQTGSLTRVVFAESDYSSLDALSGARYILEPPTSGIGPPPYS
jgi:hypothetical protein